MYLTLVYLVKYQSVGVHSEVQVCVVCWCTYVVQYKCELSVGVHSVVQVCVVCWCTYVVLYKCGLSVGVHT